MRGGLSFRELVERLERQAESVGGRQASLVEEGAEGVRLLTVHSAKGLEFPVVILADLTCSLARAEPSMHADSRRGLWAGQLLGCAPAELKEHADLEQGRDEAEGTRIAYVAATRARDLLVVTAVGAEGRSGWLQALNRALYPQPDRYHLAEPAPGCPLRGSLTVLGLGSYRGEPPRVIRPGRHRPAAGGPEVVWWDPATLDLEPRGHFGERQTEILAEDPAAEEEGMTRYRSWSADVAAARQKGSTPSVRIVPVTSLAVQPPRVGAVSVERVEGIPDRPRGARFGALVHAVLRDVPFDAGAGEALSRAQALARALDAPEPEIVAAAETVSRALGHPLLRQAARADRVLREVPFVIPTDDGQIVEGVVDLAFRSEEAWTVVDFKTHEVGGEERERYERQVHWYLWALQTLRGGEARGVILEI
jgi:ATP-dependent exoDNAse (exonuclease V) beta subunit